MSNINDLSPDCSIITGDFNARSTKWWKLDKENLEGREINIITRAAVYSQLINQSKHLTKYFLSCIDLIFTSNPNLINSSGVEMSLFEKCHHNIVYGKIDFKIPILTPYMREIWDYKNASTESIQRSVSSTDWDFLFWGKSISKKVDILNECLKNIFHNFVPNKVIKCDYRQPAWVTYSMKNKLKERAKLTKKYFKGGKKDSDLVQINVLSNECTKSILETKEKYISHLSQKPIDRSTDPKKLEVINRFVNNKKTSIIPRLLVNNKIISNFSEKANLFNKFFASQCTPLENNSSLPPICLKTDKSLLSLE